MTIEAKEGFGQPPEEEINDPYKTAEQLKDLFIEKYPDKVDAIEDVCTFLNSIEDNHEQIEKLHGHLRNLLEENIQVTEEIRQTLLFNMLLGSKLEQERWEQMSFDTSGKIVEKLFYDEIKGGE